jgi:DNA-binding NtrC family response regulator
MKIKNTTRGPDSGTDRIAPEDEFDPFETGELMVIEGQQAGRKLQLSTGGVTIGSGTAVDLFLGDPGVSRRHARVMADRGTFLLEDLNSTNGTFLNGRRIRAVYLGRGDLIAVGQCRLRFQPAYAEFQIPPSQADHFGSVYGTSPAMRQLFGILERVAPKQAGILIVGESGTGKDLLARAIHDSSARALKPFIVVDASVASAELLASELFGHVEGAFTGAHRRRQGAFEAASKGTIFLDEIGELPLDLQPKFLRVLESRQITPVGSNLPNPIDVRILAATNRDLAGMVKAGLFREDLYYRLAVVQLEMPPLRDRREDIPGIVSSLVARRREAADEPVSVTPAALSLLAAQPWPGNVRELRNVLDRALALSQNPTISAADIEMALMGTKRAPIRPPDAVHTVTRTGDPAVQEPPTASHDAIASDKSLDEIQREVVQNALKAVSGNQSAAARQLGIHRNALRTLMKKYGLR